MQSPPFLFDQQPSFLFAIIPLIEPALYTRRSIPIFLDRWGLKFSGMNFFLDTV